MSDVGVIHRRSALEAFACPWRYHEIVVRQVPDDSPEAQRGQCVHAAARLYVHALAAARIPQDADTARWALDEAIRETLPPAHQIDDIRDVWQRWAERFELDIDAFLLAEVKQIRGRRTWTPDVIYARPGVLEVADLKTFYVGLTPAHARTLMQTRFYIAEAAKIWPGFDTYRMTYDFMRLGWSVSVDFARDEVDELDEIVRLVELGADAARTAGHYPAKPGPHCDFCRLACPMEAELRASGRLTAPLRMTTEAEAVRAAEEYLVLARAAELRRDALEVWVATMGEIDIAGTRFEFRVQQTERYPAADVYRALGVAVPMDAAGSDLTLSKTAVGRYLKNRRWAHAREAIARLAQVTTRSVFSVSVPGRTRRPSGANESEA